MNPGAAARPERRERSARSQRMGQDLMWHKWPRRGENHHHGGGILTVPGDGHRIAAGCASAAPVLIGSRYEGAMA
jgi:hypothetical protein